MHIRVSKLERNIIKAFKGSVKDFNRGKIEGKDDFKASIYHHLREYTDKNKLITMSVNHSVGNCKPDISIFKDDNYLVAIELKTIYKEKGNIKPYDPSSIKTSIEQLKQCALHYERGYFIHIDEKEGVFDDNFAEWKDDYYRNLWYEVEDDRTYVFEAKKSRTNKRRV